MHINKVREREQLELNRVLALRKKIVQKKGYARDNDFLEIVGYELKKNTLVITLRNKSTSTIDKFYGDVTLTDGILYDYYINNKAFEALASIKPGEKGSVFLELRKRDANSIRNSRKTHLFMQLMSITANGTRHSPNDYNSEGMKSEVLYVQDKKISESRYYIQGMRESLDSLCVNNNNYSN